MKQRLIDANALTMAVLKKAIDDAFLNGNTDMHKLLISVVAHQPTIDAEPVRHGKWIAHGDCGVTECSCCGWNIEECVGWNYCPNCGARMDKHDEIH